MCTYVDDDEDTAAGESCADAEEEEDEGAKGWAFWIEFGLAFCPR